MRYDRSFIRHYERDAPLTLDASGGTRGIMQPVTHPESHPETRYASEALACVIPSRAHTHFSFLRSKTLKSKHKTTHNAREENFGPVDKSNPVSRSVLRPGGANSQNSSPEKSSSSKIKTPTQCSRPRSDAQLDPIRYALA